MFVQIMENVCLTNLNLKDMFVNVMKVSKWKMVNVRTSMSVEKAFVQMAFAETRPVHLIANVLPDFIYQEYIEFTLRNIIYNQGGFE